ncbi:hypothetical protein [Peptostreptococcus faecalis]|uniref:hypothetical protein n=1 Tax=Peptostreptococcus faecalis TaxID=2045015 RepID=UPI000C7DF82A|nr:hypothetical protein [Peptostreptococcus faecalis]
MTSKNDKVYVFMRGDKESALKIIDPKTMKVDATIKIDGSLSFNSAYLKGEKLYTSASLAEDNETGAFIIFDLDKKNIYRKKKFDEMVFNMIKENDSEFTLFKSKDIANPENHTSVVRYNANSDKLINSKKLDRTILYSGKTKNKDYVLISHDKITLYDKNFNIKKDVKTPSYGMSLNILNI